MTTDTSEAAVLPKTEPRPEGQVSRRRNITITSGYTNDERIRIMLCPELVRLRDRKNGKERGDLMVQRVSNAIKLAMDDKNEPLQPDDYPLYSGLVHCLSIMRSTKMPREERIELIRGVLRPFLKKGA